MKINPFVMPADITAKVDEIMSASRARFGHDAFRMEDPPKPTPPASDPPPAAPPAGDPPPADPPASDPPGADALGDAGKKALDAMKAKWKAAEEKAKASDEARAALEAKIAGTEAEHAASQEAQRIRDEALAGANERIKKAEVRAAAASKLADPQDALRFLDLSDFEVDSDGAVDAAQIATAIDDLIANKPYLAAQGGKKFQGSADGGARNDANTAGQLSRDDIARMSPEQIAEAEAKGQFDGVLGRS